MRKIKVALYQTMFSNFVTLMENLSQEVTLKLKFKKGESIPKSKSLWRTFKAEEMGQSRNRRELKNWKKCLRFLCLAQKEIFK